jgi:CRP-like cAMP-binding protein
LVLRLSGGEGVEVAMVGNESVFGGGAAINGQISLSDALVQQAGPASTIEMTHLRRAAQESAPLRTQLFRHEQLLFLQAQQSAACNAAHTVDARLSRWLLRMYDLVETPNLAITQEFLAQMIGARRNSVSIVAATLQNAGVIRYTRGRVEITDVEGLKRCACECYGSVKMHYDRLLRKAP